MSFENGFVWLPKGQQPHFNNAIECLPIPGFGDKLSDCITLCSSHVSLLPACCVLKMCYECEVGAPHVTCDVAAGLKAAVPFSVKASKLAHTRPC